MGRSGGFWPSLKFVLFVLLPVLIALAGLYMFRPEVSVAPNVYLNPSDPFATAFTVKNSGELFALRDVQAGCNGSMTYIATRTQTINPVVISGRTVSVPKFCCCVSC